MTIAFIGADGHCLRFFMYYPSTPLLEIVELLQGGEWLNGGDLADQLNVDRSTMQTYIGTLQEMGLPVEAMMQQGGHRQYRLLRAKQLPPRRWQVDVLLKVAEPYARQLVSLPSVMFTPAEKGTLLRIYTYDLDKIAFILLQLDCDFTILRPQKLEESFRHIICKSQHVIGHRFLSS